MAVVEVVSSGNKTGRKALDDFVRQAAKFLEHGIHLLILDLQPPSPLDPQGIHGAIWSEVAGEDYVLPAGKPLTLATYDAGPGLTAFIEPVAVGDTLIDMPLFLGLPSPYKGTVCPPTPKGWHGSRLLAEYHRDLAKKALPARSASAGYVDSCDAMANALAGASGWYVSDLAATGPAVEDGRIWPVVFREECP